MKSNLLLKYSRGGMMSLNMATLPGVMPLKKTDFPSPRCYQFLMNSSSKNSWPPFFFMLEFCLTWDCPWLCMFSLWLWLLLCTCFYCIYKSVSWQSKLFGVKLFEEFLYSPVDVIGVSFLFHLQFYSCGCSLSVNLTNTSKSRWSFRRTIWVISLILLLLKNKHYNTNYVPEMFLYMYTLWIV